MVIGECVTLFREDLRLSSAERRIEDITIADFKDVGNGIPQFAHIVQFINNDGRTKLLKNRFEIADEVEIKK